VSVDDADSSGTNADLASMRETSTAWYGRCERNGRRCFGSVVGDRPEFLARGRWTPPCCLEGLRTTARFVIALLERANARYWLEYGTLLGAARSGDIIPWDYDMDIGIHRDDLELVPPLLEAWQRGAGHHVELDGFVIERAREGEFLRVQYSSTNHLHVDLWPFWETAEGMMTKGSWMASHRQDVRFNASYLKPLERTAFLGMSVRVPNRMREFLELKFGRGCIENPRYPEGG
jgi:fukutin-related protein